MLEYIRAKPIDPPHDPLNTAEVNRIVLAYADLLAEVGKPKFMDESALPASKAQVKLALQALMSSATSQEQRLACRAAYKILATFLPGAPSNLFCLTAENVEEWCGLAEKLEAESELLERELEELESRISPFVGITKGSVSPSDQC